MKVFFSYGHEHKDFVQALAQEIKKQSNGEIEPWFDAWDIKEYSHWRAEITKGILESRGVVAFLSKQGLREGGVCLDELAIAITSKYGMIKSVLLDKTVPETDFMPPAMLAEYQWADMSDYRNQENLDEYIKAKAAEIVAMLTSDEIKEYNSSLGKIREKLGLPEISSELSKFDRLINTRIIGRSWLNAKVSEWLQSPDNERILMLYGKPGSGKSIYAAHLSHYNPYVAATIACNYQSNEFSDTDRVIDWLAYRLALRLPDYRSWLISVFSDNNYQLGSGLDRFSQLITQPLSRLIDGDRQTMLVVIDGLDEMKNSEFATFLAENIDSICHKLRFLITSRRESTICNQFEEYPCINLDDYVGENNADLREYFEDKLEAIAGCYGYNEFLGRLVEASEGVFTYAECVCNNILDDYKKNPSMELATYALPKGIMQLFKSTMDRRDFSYMDMEYGKLDYQGFWQVPLGMVLFAPTAITKQTLCKLMNWRENAYQAFMRPLVPFVEENNGKLRGFHKSFGEWLDQKGDKYATSKEDAIYNLAKRCYILYKKDIEKLDEFMLCNLTKLLREASLTEEYEIVVNDENFSNKLNSLLVESNALGRTSVEFSICEELITVYKGMSKEIAIARYKLGGWYIIYADLLLAKGYLAKGLAYYDAAFEVYEELIKEYPGDSDCKVQLCNIMNKKSAIMSLTTAYEAPLEYIGKSIEVIKSLAQDSDNADYKYTYANSLFVRGIVQGQNGQLQEAFEDTFASIQIMEALLQQEPQSTEFASFLYGCYGNLGHIFDNMGDYSQAKFYYQKCIKLCEELLLLQPENVNFRSGLSNHMRALGTVLEHNDEIELALECYVKSLKIDEQLILEVPDNYEFQNSLSQSYGYLADILVNSQEAEQAYEYYFRAAKLLEKLVESNPQIYTYKFSLAGTYQGMGQALTDIGETEGAVECYEKSVVLCEQALKENSHNDSVIEELALTIFTAGSNLVDLEQYGYAKKYFNRSKELYGYLFEKYPDNMEYCEYIFLSLEQVGIILFCEEEDNEALNYYEQSLIFSKKMVEADPVNCEYWGYLAGIYGNIGDANSRIGQFKAAIDYYLKCIEIHEHIMAMDPDSVVGMREIIYSQFKIANCYYCIGDKQKAKENFAKVLDLLECADEVISEILEVIREQTIEIMKQL